MLIISFYARILFTDLSKNYIPKHWLPDMTAHKKPVGKAKPAKTQDKKPFGKAKPAKSYGKGPRERSRIHKRYDDQDESRDVRSTGRPQRTIGRPSFVRKSAPFAKPSIKEQVAVPIESIGNELIYGAHPIIELLKAKKRKIVALYTTKPLPSAWDRIKPYLPKPMPNTQYVPRDVLDRMAGSTEHMGVLAWVTPFKFTSTPFDPAKKPFILLLDAVQDVRNMGAILRSAYCTGVTGVVLCKSKSAPLTAAACKAAAGLVEHLDIYLAPSVKAAVIELKKAGYNFYMAVLDGQNAAKVQYKGPLCLVIGNEAVGISKDVKALGQAITLPQLTPDISYNASVAAGILLFQIATDIKILK